MTAIRPGDNPALLAATEAMPGIMIKLIRDAAGHAGVVLSHNYPDARHVQHLDCELGVLQAARLILTEHHEPASVEALLPAIARARQRAADLDACLGSLNVDPEAGS